MVHLNLLAATYPPSPSTATTNMQVDLMYKHASSLLDYHDIYSYRHDRGLFEFF